ncbi:hypothetical protein [Phytohabitans rumicis]|uniref:hypothetical protein n=1 Tax=Phytohabitans rumicis TaxID=1076125 RepID=UPI00156661C9|nr:hypothetical protein [Phytohabitans rumicis]
MAEAVNAHVYLATGRVSAMNAHYVSRLERGVRRYPTADYRAALRAVLRVTTDAELGFMAPSHVSGWAHGAPSANEAVATPFAGAPSQAMVTRLVVMPGMAAVVVVAADRPVLLTLVDGYMAWA